ncbi:undecaprenol kinase [Fontibacillus phaseoli]|uniref:Undecaprenol kinase n=1 Tax=Fontibacillus phaseoli TaxID=1416533 RepID=A0A369BQ88_9BACL|nr:diacylglycerol kinase family protein [Fontibacillus phaseoli]RCX22776.1 undecaprenol kinase [Fontibacillus phaseoli]
MESRRSWSATFRNAWNGIWNSLKTERNMRIHVAAAIIVLLAAFFFGLPFRDIALLLLVISLVITAELLNTAIEAAVDLVTPEWHRLAKVAKDAAAGAVLIAAAFAVLIGILLFYGPVLSWLGWERFMKF